MNSEHIPSLSPDLIWRSLDDGIVVVSPDEGAVRALNETGSRVWELIDGENTVGDITRHLTEEYEISSQQAYQDVTEFLLALGKRGLVSWDANTQSSDEAGH